MEGFDLLTFDDPYTGRSVKGIDLQAGEKTIARYLDRHERNGYPFDTIALQVASDFTPPSSNFLKPQGHGTHNGLTQDFGSPLSRTFFIPWKAVPGPDPSFAGRSSGWVGRPQLGEANLAALGRQTEINLPDAERLSTLAFLVANGPARQDEFLDAYHRLILWEEHTIEWWDIRADIYVDESQGGGKQHWEEKAAHARTANAAAQRIGQETGRKLSSNIAVASPLSGRLESAFFCQERNCASAHGPMGEGPLPPERLEVG